MIIFKIGCMWNIENFLNIKEQNDILIFNNKDKLQYNTVLDIYK